MLFTKLEEQCNTGTNSCSDEGDCEDGGSAIGYICNCANDMHYTGFNCGTFGKCLDRFIPDIYIRWNFNNAWPLSHIAQI